MVYGVAIIAIMLLSPDGLFWTVRDRWFRQKAAATDSRSGAPRRLRPARASAHAGAPLLKVENLSRAFGGLKAVSEVSFSVAEGEILGIIGPNGAGKTTLFNVLNGVLAADEGSAQLDGQPMLGRKTFEVCRMGVGRTFQVVRSFPRLPVLDNVIVGAYGAGLSDRDAIASAVRALHQVGLHDRSGVAAGQLTNKQLRLMELARALAGNPRLLLLDETLAGLGREECDDVLDVLAPAARAGHDDLHHRAYNARDDAPRRPVRGAGPRPRARHRACRAPSSRTTSVIEAYLGKKWLARQDA